MIKGAAISKLGYHRYSLWRIWDSNKAMVVFVLLNPSTADASQDDPTLRRCIGFAQSWGFGGLYVVNLFAFRATDPFEMKSAPNPVGPMCDKYIMGCVGRSEMVVCGWGCHGSHLGRDREVLDMLKSPYHLGLTKNGHPKHPLYLKRESTPTPFQ